MFSYIYFDSHSHLGPRANTFLQTKLLFGHCCARITNTLSLKESVNLPNIDITKMQDISQAIGEASRVLLASLEYPVKVGGPRGTSAGSAGERARDPR